MERERVVITGYGIRGPQISNTRDFKSVLTSGVRVVESVPNVGPLGSSIVCGRVSGDISLTGIRTMSHYPRVSLLALAASQEAVERAQWYQDILGSHDDISVIIGSSAGGLHEIEEGTVESKNRSYHKFPRFGASRGNFHSSASAISAYFGIKGMCLTLASGCTAGVDAVGLGKTLIESGRVKACVVGGTDAPLTSYSLYSFAKLHGITMDGEPNETGVPFSSDHKGFVMSEGAGVLTLESETSALRRQARIYGVVEDVSSNNDAVAIHKSDTTGESMLRALRGVLHGTIPSYINSQALGLQDNDRVEQYVHRQLFGSDVPITSIKGTVGHAFAAAGIFQVISAINSIEDGVIPPTIGTQGHGFEDLPIVFEPKVAEVDSVAITAHGFGGNNTCLLIKRYEKS